jgi:hypothetical protein
MQLSVTIKGATSGHLSPEDAATVLGLTAATLAKWRYLRKGPPFAKPDGWRIAYPVADLVHWIESGEAWKHSRSWERESRKIA